MTKHIMTFATLAVLAAPAFAADNHSYIDSCPANKYECDLAPTTKHVYKDDAPFAASQPTFDDREERRLQENNTRAGVGSSN
jgi:hypothetical protein